ncbi:hypothetical protein SRHO_G00303240 [Serrasalmus rhombeus]
MSSEWLREARRLRVRTSEATARLLPHKRTPVSFFRGLHVLELGSGKEPEAKAVCVSVCAVLLTEVLLRSW